MGTYQIKAKNGGVYEVSAANDAQASRMEGFINSRIDAGDAELTGARPPDGGIVDRASFKQKVQKPKPAPNLDSTLGQGILFGLSDEVAGAGAALGNMLAAPFSDRIDFDPKSAYLRGKADKNAVLDSTREAYPWGAFGTEVLGGVVAPGGMAKQVGMLGSLKAGAKMGAAYGGLSGFGYGEGFDGSIAGAGLGAAGGGMLGTALPLAFGGLRKTYMGAKSYLAPETGIGRELVVRAMKEDKLTPRAVGEAMDAARGRGSPMMIGDMGDNLRGLTGSVSRKPGESRTLVRNAVNERQMGQGERVRSAIARDLGPIADPDEVSDKLLAQARARSKPLYDEAYAATPVFSPELVDVLETPAGRAAVAKAMKIAANERRDPMKLGFALDADGNPVLNPVQTVGENAAGDLTVTQNPVKAPGYSPETIDLVKRGLDDALEGYRNPLNRKLELDEEGRAINQVRSELVREADRLNPKYGEARAAFAGPAREKEALDRGRSALHWSAQELERRTANMSPPEREQFALGLRASMAGFIEKRVDGADKVGAIMGTPRKRAAMAKVFGSGENFDQFVATMADERMANETYRAVSTGSQTASRSADDAITEDASLLGDVAGNALRGAANGGMTGAVANVFQGGLRKFGQFGAGKTGQRAREDAATLLSQIDPDALRQAMRETMRQQALRRVRQRGVDRGVNQVGNLGARGLGVVSGLSTQPLDDPFEGR